MGAGELLLLDARLWRLARLSDIPSEPEKVLPRATQMWNGPWAAGSCDSARATLTWAKCGHLARPCG